MCCMVYLVMVLSYFYSFGAVLMQFFFFFLQFCCIVVAACSLINTMQENKIVLCLNRCSYFKLYIYFLKNRTETVWIPLPLPNQTVWFHFGFGFKTTPNRFAKSFDFGVAVSLETAPLLPLLRSHSYSISRHINLIWSWTPFRNFNLQ